MPSLSFAFGLGKYFSFTFNIQLGRAPENQAKPAQDGYSKPSTADQSTTTETNPSLDSYNDCWATSEEQLLDLTKAASNPQPLSQQTPFQTALLNAVGFGDGPALGTSNTSTTTKPFTHSVRPIPRTPQTRGRMIPPLIPSRKSKTKLFQQNRHVPTRAPVPSPRLTKPLGRPLPMPPESGTPGTPCNLTPCFQTLPLEIKHMIYHQLLVSKDPIKKPHRLVCNKRSIMLDTIQPVKDIDSSILRVCRTIYDEALPILYGQNTFEFAKPRKLRDFSHGYLDKRGPKFAFREAQAGRFTLIRSVVLRLGYDRKPYAFQRPGGVTPAVPDRKRIWSHWHQYFFNDNDSRNQFDFGWFPTMGNEFPALDKVELDFTDWQLGEGDVIRVEPFVSKFSKSGGLSSVTIKAVKNSINLEQLRRGLVKPGGTFTAID